MESKVVLPSLGAFKKTYFFLKIDLFRGTVSKSIFFHSIEMDSLSRVVRHQQAPPPDGSRENADKF